MAAQSPLVFAEVYMGNNCHAEFSRMHTETFEFLRKLHEFGYGDPDCRVFNYWDEGHPVSVTGIDAKTIAMSRGGKALVVVTDYGGGGECTVRLDCAELGIAPTAKARDFETGEPIEGDARQGLRFALKKHDFKALLAA